MWIASLTFMTIPFDLLLCWPRWSWHAIQPLSTNEESEGKAGHSVVSCPSIHQVVTRGPPQCSTRHPPVDGPAVVSSLSLRPLMVGGKCLPWESISFAKSAQTRAWSFSDLKGTLTQKGQTCDCFIMKFKQPFCPIWYANMKCMFPLMRVALYHQTIIAGETFITSAKLWPITIGLFAKEHCLFWRWCSHVILFRPSVTL